MAHTLYFLTATLLAAQSGEPPLISPQAVSQYDTSCNCQQGRNQQMVPGQDAQSQQRPGLWGRVRNIFQRNRQSSQQQTYDRQHGQPGRNQRQPMTEPPLLTGEPPLAEPAVALGNHMQTAAIARAPQQGASVVATPLNPKVVNKIGHEEDYSWVTGQLFQENGHWIVRYATADTVDRFQGVFILAGEKSLDEFRHGDLVSARGKVVPNPRGGLTLYQVTTVDLIERVGR